MRPTDITEHAKSFADHLHLNASSVHAILRKCQSKQVVDYEIEQSLKTLRNLSKLNQYFTKIRFSRKTVSFLPLNLPLYSFILFAAMPAYQSESLVIRVPHRMHGLFNELFNALSFEKYYPNVQVFTGSRKGFLDQHCKKASVVIFTGKYKNFLIIRKVCNKNTLILFNGVGHNPLVITPSADIDLAVEKTLQIKLFNNGQDCAGPDTILVHSLIIDLYINKLLKRLKSAKCGDSYYDDDVIVGPLFESSSMLDITKLIFNIRNQGAEIVYGGQIDVNSNIVYPCVIRAPLYQLTTYDELYSPLFIISEYRRDQELALYFDDPNARYQNNEMYISLFGESIYVSKKARGSIILKNRVIHDVEHGTEEYGGYSHGASSVSYKSIRISKPLLVPREIHNFLSQQGQEIFTSFPKIKSDLEQQVITTQFQKTVQNIFKDQLVFAYIFGTFATKKDKRYSDIDTFICIRSQEANHVRQYLSWLFHIHEMFGRILDFKYPTEIMLLRDLQTATSRLSDISLSAIQNEAKNYDAMVWCHSLSQPWIGTINPEAMPNHWKELFPKHSSRLLRSFLTDLKKNILAGEDLSHLQPEIHEAPLDEPELSQYIKNLSNRGLVDVLKMIPFEEKSVYTRIVLELVAQREFIGKNLFDASNSKHLYHPCFRFGTVAPIKS